VNVNLNLSYNLDLDDTATFSSSMLLAEFTNKEAHINNKFPSYQQQVLNGYAAINIASDLL
jgi:hypothetical protein